MRFSGSWHYVVVQRVPQHVRRPTWRSRLYIDDVQEIVDVLGADGAEVEISVPGWSTKGGADELLQFKNKTLREIQILRARPVFVTVNLQPYGGHVYGAEDDATTVGLVNKAEDILRRCRRWPSIIVFNYITSSVLMLSWVGFILAIAAGGPLQWPPQWSIEMLLRSAPALPILLLLGGTIWITLKRHTLIFCSHRSDAPSFWRRNKDSITGGIIIAAVSSLITFVVTKALG